MGGIRPALGGSAGSCGSTLGACLMAPPAGSQAWTNSRGWTRTPSVKQFADHMYTNSYAATAEARLDDQGVTGIAHETWKTVNGNEADTDPLQFSTTQGAQSRTEEELHYRSGTDFSVPGPGSAGGMSLTKPDLAGFYPTSIYGYSGSVAVEVHTYAKSADRDEAIAWAQSEFKLISADTKAGTEDVSAPRPPSNLIGHVGTASCAAPVDCLMTPPVLAIGWTDDAYDETTAVTLASSWTTCTAIPSTESTNSHG